MKKYFALLLLLPLVFGGCDDDKSYTETWTVAPEKGVTGVFMGFGYVPAYIVKKGSDADWEIAPGPIEGFAFEKGYQTDMLVRIDHVPNPPADGSSLRYTMIRQLSRIPAEPSVDPKTFSPELEIVIASERADNHMAAYWFKDTRYPEPRWQAFPWEIEGFDFKPGYEAHVRIQPVAEYDKAQEHLIDNDSWTVKYNLKELISSEKKNSEGLPGF